MTEHAKVTTYKDTPIYVTAQGTFYAIDKDGSESSGHYNMASMQKYIDGQRSAAARRARRSIKVPVKLVVQSKAVRWKTVEGEDRPTICSGFFVGHHGSTGKPRWKTGKPLAVVPHEQVLFVFPDSTPVDDIRDMLKLIEQRDTLNDRIHTFRKKAVVHDRDRDMTRHYHYGRPTAQVLDEMDTKACKILGHPLSEEG